MNIVENSIEIGTKYYFKNNGKHRIFFAEDFVPNAKANVVIISPFGKTLHDLFLIKSYLTINSFNVFRFDPKNHVGLSNGIMEDFHLSSLEEDVEFAYGTFELDSQIPTIFLCISLSFPVTIKFVSNHSEIAGVVSLVGAVNPEDTSSKATNFDLNEYRKENATPPIYHKPFGCLLKGASYVHGLDKGKFSNMLDIIQYAQNLQCPLHMIVSEQDEYVSYEDTKTFYNSINNNSAFIVLPGLTHEIGRSLSAARRATEKIIYLANKIVNFDHNVIIPKLTDIIKASSIESTFLNEYNITKE